MTAAFATAAGLIISSAISHNPAVNQCRVSPSPSPAPYSYHSTYTPEYPTFSSILILAQPRAARFVFGIAIVWIVRALNSLTDFLDRLLYS